MMRSTKGLYAVVSLLLFFSTGYAQDKVRFSGQVFGDYYFMMKNHNESLEGENAFWFRRIYLTFDHDLSDDFSMLISLELRRFQKTVEQLFFVQFFYGIVI